MHEDETAAMAEADEATETESTDANAETAQAAQDAPDFKAKWEGQRKVSRDLEAKLKEANERLAEFGKSAEEIERDKAQREVERAALATANQRILRSEVRGSARGRLADPDDALKYLKLDKFEVGDDGEVDSDAIEAAISELIAERPYLAAEGAARFRGGADQGAKGKTAALAQVTQQELETMTPEQIGEARKAGRLNKLMGVS